MGCVRRREYQAVKGAAGLFTGFGGGAWEGTISKGYESWGVRATWSSLHSWYMSVGMDLEVRFGM